MLLRRFTDIYPKELARDMRELFNSLLGGSIVGRPSTMSTSSLGLPPRARQTTKPFDQSPSERSVAVAFLVIVARINRESHRNDSILIPDR